MNPSLKKSFPYFIFLLILSVGLFIACRRSIDIKAEDPIEKRFFDVPANASPAAKAIAASIKKQNDKKNFIKDLVKRSGYPRWSKTMEFKSKPGNRSGRSQTGDSAEVIYIPFVQDNEDFTNSSLIVLAEASDTTYKMLYDKQYSAFGFDSTTTNSWNAKSVFHLFVQFDYSIFGRTMFYIKDGRIFGFDTTEKFTATIRVNSNFSQGSGRPSEWVEQTDCIDVYTRISCPGQRSTTDFVCYGWTQSCFPYAVWVSGEGSSGGGGGSGNGEWYDDPCDNGTDPTPRSLPNIDPCSNGGGWEPFYPMANLSSIIDSLSNPCLIDAKNKITDSSLHNFITNLYYLNYNTTDVHIKFREDTTLEWQPGDPKIADSYVVISTQTWTISLNTKFFDGTYLDSTSKEYAAQLILHEIVHSFIFLYKDKLGLTQLSDFTIHEVMFNNWILRMRDALKGAFPSLTTQEATALALTGIDDVLEAEYDANGTLSSYNDEMNNFANNNYNMSIPQADSISTGFIFGTKGTKCQ